MTNLEIMLRDFHRWEAATPFRYGRHDCSLRLADWWQFVHGGADPAASLRGGYTSRHGAALAIGRAGTLVRLVAQFAEGVGARPAEALDVGTFGVATLAGSAPVGFLATRSFLTFRLEGKGIVFVPPGEARVLSMWDVV
jgi:hypothetical protein